VHRIGFEDGLAPQSPRRRRLARWEPLAAVGR
jgi:hypothetical protein